MRSVSFKATSSQRKIGIKYLSWNGRKGVPGERERGGERLSKKDITRGSQVPFTYLCKTALGLRPGGSPENLETNPPKQGTWKKEGSQAGERTWQEVP